MPQLIALALVGGLLWYVYRVFKRQMAHMERERRANEQRVKEARLGTELVEDKDGVYRPDSSDKE